MSARDSEEIRAGLAEIRSRDLESLETWLGQVKEYIQEPETDKWIDSPVQGVPDLPSPEELAELVKLVGEASLYSEEGTYHQLAVLYLPSNDDLHLLGNLVSCTWEADEKAGEKASSSTLAKLAPLCIPYHTYLAVKKRPTGGFDCWGIVDLTTRLRCNPKYDMTNPDPEKDPDAKFRFPQLDLAHEPAALWLHSLRPGHVEGGWRDRLISLSNLDFLLWEVPAVKKRAQSWAEEDLWGRTLCGCYRAYLFTFFLEHVVGAMIMKGVGGTLLLALDSAGDQIDGHEKLDLKESKHRRQTRSSLPSICDRIAECVKAFSLEQALEEAPTRKHMVFPFLPETKLPHHLRSLSSFIANLSSIDGALILDRHLNVLGFGEKITSEITDHLDNLSGSAKKVAAAHGSRHTSTLSWVAAGKRPRQLNRVAIVVSSDRKAHVAYWSRPDNKRNPGQVKVRPVVYRRT